MRRARYKVELGGPDESLDAATLADRVRSNLGPLTKQLDVPHVHVMAVGHHLLIHGDVATQHDADRIEEAVMAMPGVDSVESYLHVGLLASDSRPSDGGVGQNSRAFGLLKSATRDVGLHGRPAEAGLRVAISAFLDSLPEGTRRHVLSHLPDDVKALATPPTRRHAAHIMSLAPDDDLVGKVASSSGLLTSDARRLTKAVLQTLAELVPEEVVDISNALPARERALWNDARGRSAAGGWSNT
jgi:hypothetical protein